MPIFHGHTARNVLLTDIFKILAEQADLKLVIFTYDFKKDYYQKEFARPNVIIEGVDDEKIDRVKHEVFFKPLFAAFAHSNRTIMVFKERLDEGGSYKKYLGRRLLAATVGRSRILREIIRWLYYRLIPPKDLFVKYFEKYKPEAVFLPDITFHIDGYIQRIARERKIPSIAMLRSWDALTSSKGTVRLKPDRLIVHNEFMKEMAVKFGDMAADDVFIGGMPHFDHYFKKKPTAKSEFFKRFGLNPNKKVVLFALTGPRTASINQDIITIVSKAINDGHLPENVQILVRMHPNSEMEEFKNDPNIIFHRPKGVYFEKGRLADMEFTEEWLQELLDSLYYSDIIINAQSTMTIDAAALDKPVINLAFDGYEKLSYIRSVRRLYDIDHYQPIIKTGGVRIVRNEEELVKWINHYLADPAIDGDGREKILTEQCWRIDGKNSQRTAELILNFISKKIAQ